ncbi:aromatic acid/H+ symport family MFS transporter [Bacillus sp. 166amftsu]|uniref:MFS transporter n=1 Tax=Bacillus sp. 166amftsu TaxID=1761753 RepID=UPI001FCD8538|nr:aromatic acid/H+ symport family MFS transporter [Bacillus sp. 166amftsu]
MCCIFIIIVDGYDMFMLGAILPALMAEWGMDAVAAGKLGSYALFGMMIGAMFFGPLADRFGRKNVILICTIIFTVFTFISGFANAPSTFGFQRFVAGIGLGGVMPNLIALVTEYAPKKLRNTLVAIMFSGHAFGGILASLGALALLPLFGWRAVVWVAGVPLLVLPFLYKVLPESYSYYVKENKKDRLISTLHKISPKDQFSKKDEFFMNVTDNTDTSIKKLFTEKRALSTLMFWVAAFMCLLVMYGLSTWLPKIMQSSGYPVGSSLLFLITLNLGAVVGAIFGGKLADRFGSRKILITFFVLGFLSLTALSLRPNAVLLYVLLFIAGGTTTGTQINTNSYVSQFYPSGIRSTGVGWELGVGRIGGILGPTLGGFLLSSQLPLQFNFMAFAIPCIIGAIAIWLVQEKYGQTTVRITNKSFNTGGLAANPNKNSN